MWKNLLQVPIMLLLYRIIDQKIIKVDNQELIQYIMED